MSFTRYFDRFRQLIALLACLISIVSLAEPRPPIDQSLSFPNALRVVDTTPVPIASDDAQLNVLFKRAELYKLFHRIDLLQTWLVDAEQQLQGNETPLLRARWHYYQAFCQYFGGEYSAADNALQAALVWLNQVPDALVRRPENAFFVTEVKLLVGLNMAYLQDYDKAIALITEQYEHARQQKWPSLEARSLHYLGDVNYELKHYESAQGYYQQALDSYPQDNWIERSYAQMAVAQMINIVGDKVIALVQLDKVIEAFERQANLSGLADAYLLKSYFISASRPEEALDWIGRSVSYREKLGVPSDIANAYVHYSQLLLNNGKQELALSYASKAVNISEQNEDLTGRWDAYYLYANALAQAGQFEQAFTYMAKAERTLLKKARLDITNETARLAVKSQLAQQKLEKQYAEQQKDMLSERNALLQAKLDLQADIQQKQNWALYLLLGFLVLSFALLSIIFRLYCKTKVLASRDVLTGLNNRRSILTIAEREFNSSLRYQYGFSVIMLDVDNFKQINDTYGHDGGDRALKHVATICQQLLRKSDFVGRIGGEEFLFVLPHTFQADALNLAERIRQDISQIFRRQHQEFKHLTVSLGVASRIHDVNESLEQIITRADKALYEAKNGGRNRVEVIHQDASLVGA